MMIDEDDSGTLTKDEITTAANRQPSTSWSTAATRTSSLLVPARLKAALAELDTDRSGEVNLPEWRAAASSRVAAAPHRFILRREAAIESALRNKLEAKKKAREAAAAAAARDR